MILNDLVNCQYLLTNIFPIKTKLPDLPKNALEGAGENVTGGIQHTELSLAENMFGISLKWTILYVILSITIIGFAFYRRSKNKELQAKIIQFVTMRDDKIREITNLIGKSASDNLCGIIDKLGSHTETYEGENNQICTYRFKIISDSIIPIKDKEIRSEDVYVLVTIDIIEDKIIDVETKKIID